MDLVDWTVRSVGFLTIASRERETWAAQLADWQFRLLIFEETLAVTFLYKKLHRSFLVQIVFGPSLDEPGPELTIRRFLSEVLDLG